IANALPLGATSSGEMVDFELTETMELSDFEQRLKAVFPVEIPIHQVELVDLKAPATTALLDWAEYQIQVRLEEAVSVNQWQSWIEQILAKEEILLEKKTKSGKAKTLNLREHLFELSCLDVVNDPTDMITLIYRGSGRNDGTLLQPEHLIYMLEQVAQREFELVHTHRQQFGLILAIE
ncbi:MAG: TIGR03936 family radical SAM-associated protein, partial [Microcystaceae cyanobacterium]